MTPLEQVKQAVLQLCWAIKLGIYLSDYPPANKTDFDKPCSIRYSVDTLFLPGDQFNTHDDILLGAEHCIILSIGALFLALDTALDQAGIKNDPSARDSFGQLRILIYMARCAYAHNVLEPHWEVKPKYRRQLAIALPDIALQLDLDLLSYKPFDIQQIGGYSQLFRITDHILQVL